MTTFKKLDRDENLTFIGWSLSTSDEYIIRELAEDDGIEINNTFWGDVNSSITKFENVYEDILKKYVSACRNDGHDSDNALVGSAWVTDEQLEKIKEIAEYVSDGHYILTQSSGSLNCNELDLLHNCVLAELEFFDIPE
jgi:uncharacterized protein YabN with tetrapyrrole methylase and pyrophosphatase domain